MKHPQTRTSGRYRSKCSLLLLLVAATLGTVTAKKETENSTIETSFSSSSPLLRKQQSAPLQRRSLVDDAIEEQLDSASLPQHDDTTSNVPVKQPRIINGEDVTDPDRYPWFVHVRGSTPDNLPVLEACGGSLIAPDLVLTAAHCE